MNKLTQAPSDVKEITLFESASSLRGNCHQLCEMVENLHANLTGSASAALSASAETVSRGAVLDCIEQNREVNIRLSNAQEMIRDINRALGV